MVKTTKSNFQQQCSEILFTSLPATFGDAIDLLHALGIGYAWVDSLCIIQDDLEDWNREAARMSQVYMNGLFTIAADNAPDSSYGLFLAGTQRRISIGCLYGNVHIRPVGERQLTAAAHTLVPHRRTKATASALSSRAWVFQERVLSNRTLHFTESELAWECGSELQCECEVDATPISSTSFRSGYIESQHNSSLHLRWLVAVTDFSMRSITYPSDRLPALAGLAAVTSNNSRGRYAAGLWSAEPQFLHGLLWMAGYIDRLEQVVPSDVLRSDRQPPCYAPSWSWASITGCVNFIGSEFDQEQHALIMDARVMEVDSASKGLNPYGPVSDGNVTLVGALAEVRVVGKSPDQDPPNQIRHGMRRWEIISSGLLQDADIPAAASWMPRNSPSPFKIGSASVLDGYHILDEAYMDVDDGVEVDMHARHYFLLIGYYDFRSDPLRGQRADFDKLNEDTSPFGLLLRRQEDGTYYRIGLVVSRLRVEGVAVWKKLAVVQSVTIY
nr:hypothetical protein B0A51_18430 [Rachicladosporium sp. CCFEE 5018]